MPSEVGTGGDLKQELGIDMVMFLKACNRERGGKEMCQRLM